MSTKARHLQPGQVIDRGAMSTDRTVVEVEPLMATRRPHVRVHFVTDEGRGSFVTAADTLLATR